MRCYRDRDAPFPYIEAVGGPVPKGQASHITSLCRNHTKRTQRSTGKCERYANSSILDVYLDNVGTDFNSIWSEAHNSNRLQHLRQDLKEKGEEAGEMREFCRILMRM